MRACALCLAIALFAFPSAAFAGCEQPVQRWTTNLPKNGYTVKWLDEAQKQRALAFAQRTITDPPPDLAKMQDYPAFAAYQTAAENFAPNKGAVAFTDKDKTCVIFYFNAAGDRVNLLVNTKPKPILPN